MQHDAGATRGTDSRWGGSTGMTERAPWRWRSTQNSDLRQCFSDTPSPRACGAGESCVVGPCVWIWRGVDSAKTCTRRIPRRGPRAWTWQRGYGEDMRGCGTAQNSGVGGAHKRRIVRPEPTVAETCTMRIPVSGGRHARMWRVSGEPRQSLQPRRARGGSRVDDVAKTRVWPGLGRGGVKPKDVWRAPLPTPRRCPHKKTRATRRAPPISGARFLGMPLVYIHLRHNA
ncbi:hypothetical protein C8J57DRAFT_1628405 [Mycena rebaudengoi]|nr:hypothetical protein C8J57DRAFT_1628405 [Mycena rebaudengoi]